VTGCGPSIANTAQRLPNIACESMGCGDVNDQACGGQNVIAIYEMLPLVLIPPDGCDLTSLSQPFQLDAVFIDDPSERASITMTGIEHHRVPTGEFTFITTTEAGILSVRPFSNFSPSPFGLSYYLTQVCPTCPNPITFNLTEATLVPNLNAGTAINNLSTYSGPSCWNDKLRRNYG